MQCSVKWFLLIVSCSLCWMANGKGQDEQDDSAWMNAPTRRAISKGLAFIASQQTLGATDSGDARNDDGSFGEQHYGVAVTSFACLALMADGNTPGRGLYGLQVTKGIKFLLRCVEKNGYISRHGDESRMHGHGYATLCLAEVYGTQNQLSKEVREKLKIAIKRILESQTPDGGWGYEWNSQEHEGSVTVVQLQALRACRNVGLHVPKRSIDNAIDYIRRSANPDGSFKYRLGMAGSRQSFPLSAAGVSSLNATGEYDSREIQKGLEFMMEYLPPQGKTDRYYQAFYYYGQFYAAQAMYHAPSTYWEKWFPAMRDDLLRRQDSRTGSWGRVGLGANREPPQGSSKEREVYATSIATLVLQVPYNYLPIFQK